MDQVAEEDRLAGRPGHRHELPGRLRPELRLGQRPHVGHDVARLRLAEIGCEGRHAGRQSLGGPAVQDDVDQERVRQRVHQAAVGEVRGLRRESTGRRAVAAGDRDP